MWDGQFAHLVFAVGKGQRPGHVSVEVDGDLMRTCRHPLQGDLQADIFGRCRIDMVQEQGLLDRLRADHWDKEILRLAIF